MKEPEDQVGLKIATPAGGQDRLEFGGVFRDGKELNGFLDQSLRGQADVDKSHHHIGFGQACDAQELLAVVGPTGQFQETPSHAHAVRGFDVDRANQPTWPGRMGSRGP